MFARSSQNSCGSGHRHPALFTAALLAVPLLAGCTEEASPLEGPAALQRADSAAPAASADYPLDDVLRFNHLQAKGTHNSYHEMSIPIPAWHYTHLPLDEQLAYQGVRQFELDIHYSAVKSRFEAYHVILFDQKSNCKVLTECFADMKRWSDANPLHHPLVVLLEPKDWSADIPAQDFVSLLERDILSVWPLERIVLPDDAQGGYPTLAEAIETVGWPTLGELRGKVLFVLHDTGELRDVYTYGGQGLEGRVMFVESSPGQPFGAFVILNDPDVDFNQIQEAVLRGYLVRTRADSNGDEARANDTTRRDLAFESGAHFVSTDFPEPQEKTDYWVEVPGGTPSRCNPLTAPSSCYSEAIEDPGNLSFQPLELAGRP